MTTIEVTHWHDSDGFSRDEGYKAVALGSSYGSNTFYAKTRNEAIELALESFGVEVKIIDKPDTYEAY